MTSTNSAQVSTSAQPWYAAYPEPRSRQPPSMTRQEVLDIMEKGESISGRDYLLVDLRRTDHEGGTIRGSINLPAQSLYPTIPTFYEMIKAAGVRKVIWYCSSSRGRGTRAAGWFGDYVSDCGDSSVQSLVLLEGIKGWATAGSKYVRWMDEYNAAVWDPR